MQAWDMLSMTNAGLAPFKLNSIVTQMLLIYSVLASSNGFGQAMVTRYMVKESYQMTPTRLYLTE
eukprot:3421234-Prorocentrum_lima.AAC.1